MQLYMSKFFVSAFLLFFTFHIIRHSDLLDPQGYIYLYIEQRKIQLTLLSIKEHKNYTIHKTGGSYKVWDLQAWHS